MPRKIRVPLPDLAAGERVITGEAARYLTRVLRLGAGAELTAFDPRARLEAEVTLVAVEKDRVHARFGAPSAATALGLTDVTLVQCAAKGDKVGEVVRA